MTEYLMAAILFMVVLAFMLFLNLPDYFTAMQRNIFLLMIFALSSVGLAIAYKK